MKRTHKIIIVLLSILLTLVLVSIVYYLLKPTKTSRNRSEAFPPVKELSKGSVSQSSSLKNELIEPPKTIAKKIADSISSTIKKIATPDTAPSIEDSTTNLSPLSTGQAIIPTTDSGNIPVQLPDGYSADEIANYLYTQKTGSDPALEKNIFDQISEKTRAIKDSAFSTSDNAATPTPRSDDLIISLLDENGNSIGQSMLNQALSGRISLKSETAHAGDNSDLFNFNTPYCADPLTKAAIGRNYSCISNETANLFLSAATDVRKIAGEYIFGDLYPNDKKKIGVVVNDDQTITRSFYIKDFNLIVLAQDDVNYQKTIIHELSHAFHGLACLRPSIFEEGYAMAVETEAKPSDLDYNQYAAALFGETNGKMPNRNYRVNSGTFNDPYLVGLSYYEKILIDQPDFFIKFNRTLYTRVIADDKLDFTPGQYTYMMIDNAPKIEGREATSWFTEHTAFWDDQTLSKYNFSHIYLRPIWPVLTDYVTFPTKFFISRDKSISSYTVSAEDMSGNLFSTISINNNVKSTAYDPLIYDEFSDLKMTDYQGYQGLISFKFNLSNGQKYYQYIAKIRGTMIESPFYILTPFTPTGTIIITNESGATVTTTIENGLAIVKDCNFAAKGKYRVILELPNGVKANYQINRPTALGYTAVLGQLDLSKMDGNYTK